MIEYRTRFKRHLELWFDAPEPPGHFDVIVRQRAPNPTPNAKTTDFYTLQVDLTRDTEDLFKALARNTRAQIRKSTEVDAFTFEFLDKPTLADVNEFSAFYDVFAASKELPLTYRPRLQAQCEAGCLSLARVTSEDVAITWHANIGYGTQIGMMFSASHFRAQGDPEARKMIGRANRRLHWEEFQHYKTLGYRLYDFGGWYEGTADKQKVLINQFKEEFGGTKVHAFASEENRTLLAKAIAFGNHLRASSE